MFDGVGKVKLVTIMLVPEHMYYKKDDTKKGRVFFIISLSFTYTDFI